MNKNYINGKWCDASNKATYQTYDPADLREVTGEWPKSTVEDVARAVEGAQKAFEQWRKLTVYQRAEYLKKALVLMTDRVGQIAQVITKENGKTLKESHGEIQSAVKEMEFQINEGIRLAGETLATEREGVMAYSQRVPLGVVAVIAPWNFPFNVPGRKVVPALITGNTCVLKPATSTPGVGAEFTKLFVDAGIPAGVLNFVTGSGSVIGPALVENPSVKAVTFTGSTEVGMGIHECASKQLTRTQLEMGGKNALVVFADADLEAAADSAVLAAYACAGQWCTSTSRAIVEESVYESFVKLVQDRVAKIVVGKGTDDATTMGPVCGKSQRDGILKAIEKGKAEGAILLAGGNQVVDNGLGEGCFIEPTIFGDVTADMFLAQEEIFGPVLSVMKAKDFEDALEIANGIRFGLSSSVYTNSLDKALKFVEQTDVGLTHVNLPTALKEPQFSFGGVKLSGSGVPEAGHTGVEFFTEHKVAYVKYR